MVEELEKCKINQPRVSLVEFSLKNELNHDPYMQCWNAIIHGTPGTIYSGVYYRLKVNCQLSYPIVPPIVQVNSNVKF